MAQKIKIDRNTRNSVSIEGTEKTEDNPHKSLARTSIDASLLQVRREYGTKSSFIDARLTAEVLFDVLARAQRRGQMPHVYRISTLLVDRPVQSMSQVILAPSLNVSGEKLFASLLREL